MTDPNSSSSSSAANVNQSSSGGISTTHRQNPFQLVDDLTQLILDDSDISKHIIRGNQRFRVKLSATDVDRQLEKRIKLLSQFSLAVFQPKSEEEFENWVDVAAQVITKNQICVSLFQDAWSAVAPPSLARHISSIVVTTCHETLVNEVAVFTLQKSNICSSFRSCHASTSTPPNCF